MTMNFGHRQPEVKTIRSYLLDRSDVVHDSTRDERTENATAIVQHATWCTVFNSDNVLLHGLVNSDLHVQSPLFRRWRMIL